MQPMLHGHLFLIKIHKSFRKYWTLKAKNLSLDFCALINSRVWASIPRKGRFPIYLYVSSKIITLTYCLDSPVIKTFVQTLSKKLVEQTNYEKKSSHNFNWSIFQKSRETNILQANYQGRQYFLINKIINMSGER